ncbi:hypothetical protein W909_10845 [Dickeya zeae EC1]|nr:hypothetical protein W909_10845 [Dickeya zeae EC1]
MSQSLPDIAFFHRLADAASQQTLPRLHEDVLRILNG